MQRSAAAGSRFSRAVSAVRAALLLGATAAFGSTVWWAGSPPLREVHVFLRSGRAPRGGWTVDRFVVDGAACALVSVAVVLVGLIALNVAGVATAGRSASIDLLAGKLTPHWLRRCILAVCGLALTAPGFATVAEAHDADISSASPSAGTHSNGLRLDGLPLPDLPIAPPARVLTVQPGDSLWSIARGELEPAATDRSIAAYVTALYAANRSAIGDDPNLILPGQQLTAPGGAS